MAIGLSWLVAWVVLLGATGGVAHAQELPWHLGALNATTASAPASLNTAGVKPGPHAVVVAVIDSGVLAKHPSLSGRLLPGYDMLSAPHNSRGGVLPISHLTYVMRVAVNA